MCQVIYALPILPQRLPRHFFHKAKSCSQLKVKAKEQFQICRFGFPIHNFEQVSHISSDMLIFAVIV